MRAVASLRRTWLRRPQPKTESFPIFVEKRAGTPALATYAVPPDWGYEFRCPPQGVLRPVVGTALRGGDTAVLTIILLFNGGGWEELTLRQVRYSHPGKREKS